MESLFFFLFNCTSKANFDGNISKFCPNSVMICAVCLSEILLRTKSDERRGTLFAYMHNLYFKSIQQQVVTWLQDIKEESELLASLMFL